MRHSLPLIAAALSTAVIPHGYALDVGLSLFNESEYTTNSGRTESNEIEEWIHSPGVSLTADHSGPSVNLDVNYTLNRRFYEEDLYDDENEAAGSGNLIWYAIPERLEFTVNHTRTQSAIRSISAATPDNRQETVNTTAGPTLRFNPRRQDEILIQYLWGDRSSEETRNDATTHNSSISYVLNTSQTSSLTLTGQLNQVQYDNRFAPDIEYNIGQLTWSRQLSSLNYSVMGGHSTAKRTKDLDDVDGLILDAQITWQARPATSINFNAGRDIRDQSRNLSSGTFVDELDFSVNSDLAEVFTNEWAGITLTQRLSGRTSFDFGIALDREDYEDVASDTDREVVRLGFDHQLNTKMDLHAAVSFETQDFEDEGDEADTIRSDVYLNYALGRRLDLGFGVRYEERDSDRNFSNRNYEEWAGFVRISYDLIPLDR